MTARLTRSRAPGRAGCPTSSSSGTPSAAPPRCTRCCAATRRSSCPSSRSRGSSPATCARASSPKHAGPLPADARGVPARCSPRRPAGPARGRGLLLLPVVARPPRAAIAEVQPEARIIAILREPASFLRSLHLQLLQTHVETEQDLRRAIALGGRAARGPARSRAARTARSCCSTPSTCATSSSCAATTRCSRAEQVLVLIYDDFRADNEATVRRVLRFLGGGRDACRCGASRPTPRCACARRRSTTSCTRSRSGAAPLVRAVQAAVKALTPRRLRHARCA